MTETIKIDEEESATHDRLRQAGGVGGWTDRNLALVY